MENEKTNRLETPLMVDLHPGVLLQEELEAREMSQRALAKRMKIDSTVVNDLIKGRRNITAKTALLLEEALDTPAENWMSLQSAYDLCLERKAKKMTL